MTTTLRQFINEVLLTETNSQYAVDALKLNPYFLSSKYVMPIQTMNLLVVSKEDSLNVNFALSSYKSIPNSKKRKVPAESMLKELYASPFSDEYMFYALDTGEIVVMYKTELRSNCIPIEVPAKIIEQAKKRSVYLDSLFEAGKKPSTKEILKLNALIKYAVAV
jgi:hypothetical protein